MNRTQLLSILIGGFMTGSVSWAQDETQALHRLFNDRFEWGLREYPESAMSRGDYRYADRITDVSLAAIERRHLETREYFKRLQAIDRSKLSVDDQLNYDLFASQLRDDIDGYQYRVFLAPIGGRDGVQQNVPRMHERVRFSNREDYANYLKRLELVPNQIDHTLELLAVGLKEGRTPPQVTLREVPEQFEAVLKPDGLDPLRTPFNEMPTSIGPADQSALREQFESKTLPAVRSALARLGDYFSKEYLPHCRTGIAARDWPDGEAFYNFQLRTMTTTSLKAEEIHKIGLSEVARLRREMMAVIRNSDFMQQQSAAGELADDDLFKAFIQYLRTDPRFYYAKPEDLLSGYRDICKRVDAGLPKVFKVLPRLPYGVTEVPAFIAPQQTTAWYQPGDIRNSEAGYFYANTYALDQRPKYEMIPLAMHEAVPGHHLQIALAQELEGLPEFRKDSWYTAFGEGWALYSERLGIEMGLYSDPYDDFGRLLYEMWRACRLVVDPGMHALGWSREKAVQFMLDNTALSELNVNNEIDRYIAWPGQACGYKIGELKITELRRKGEQTLGEKFDLREFHDVVLNAGSLPLDILEKRVIAWLESERAPGSDKSDSKQSQLSEKEKIERLISQVETLEGAVFIRNGKEYDAQSAANHLRTKWKYKEKEIQSARQFIDQIATSSSMSGDPYRIRLKDGTEHPSADFLLKLLSDMES